MVGRIQSKPPARIGTVKPAPEPRVFVMAGDHPISEISDISGFPLPAKWLRRFGPPAASSGVSLYYPTFFLFLF